MANCHLCTDELTQMEIDTFTDVLHKGCSICLYCLPMSVNRQDIEIYRPDDIAKLEEWGFKDG